MRQASLVLQVAIALAGASFLTSTIAALPSAPVMTAPIVAGSTVTLAWTVPLGSTAIRLEAGTGPGEANAANVVIGAVSEYTATNVPNGTYYVRVRAIDGSGEGPPSNEVIVVVGSGASGPCSAAPGPPTLHAPSVAGNQVTFTWTPASSGCPASSFALHAGSAPGLTNIATVNVGGLRSFAASAPGGTYYVRVVARNGFGVSLPSEEVVAIVGSTPTSTPAIPVRIMYLVPTDRPLRADYAAAIQAAFLHLQRWYADRLGGPTFTLFAAQPEPCLLPQPASFYAVDPWSKLSVDARRCGPVESGGAQFVWVLYADIVGACNTPGRIGAGTLGLTIMGREDLEGLIGNQPTNDCGFTDRSPRGRWTGGAGHELGHAFGLPHPPGCDRGLSTCDSAALMWSGYARYPDTYLREDEKATLRASPFIR